MTANLQSQENTQPLATTGAIVLSVLLPFEPKITSKAKIEASIRRVAKEAEAQLLAHAVQQQVVKQVLDQLQQLFAQLDYSTHKKSVALMVTPHSGKLYYWNLLVHEAVLVGPEFEVRQLAMHQRADKEYLLLTIGDNFGGIYLGNGPRISRMVANSPVREEVRHLDATTAGNPVVQSVRHIDNALSILLRSYRYPVFVIAPPAYLKCFREISRNLSHAAALIEANPHGNDARLQQLMAPHLANWQELKETALVQQLSLAQQNGKLAVGITEVWSAASERRGRLLVVEEAYAFAAYMDQQSGTLYADTIPLNKGARKITDAVATVMEKVLADGGLVEVVQKGCLKDFMQIALICY